MRHIRTLAERLRRSACVFLIAAVVLGIGDPPLLQAANASAGQVQQALTSGLRTFLQNPVPENIRKYEALRSQCVGSQKGTLERIVSFMGEAATLHQKASTAGNVSKARDFRFSLQVKAQSLFWFCYRQGELELALVVFDFLEKPEFKNLLSLEIKDAARQAGIRVAKAADLVSKIETALKKEDLQTADSLLASALRENPTDPALLNLQGRLSGHLNRVKDWSAQLQSAFYEKDYEKVLELHARGTFPRQGVRDYFDRADSFKKQAEATLRESRELTATARKSQTGGYWADAGVLLDKALRLWPQNAEARSLLDHLGSPYGNFRAKLEEAHSLEQEGRYNSAAALYMELSKSAHTTRGGEFLARAELCRKQGLEELINLARGLEAQKDFAQAATLYRQLAEDNPAKKISFQTHADRCQQLNTQQVQELTSLSGLLRQERFTDALPMIETWMPFRERETVALQIGRKLEDLKDYNNALKYYALAQSGPDASRIQNVLGRSANARDTKEIMATFNDSVVLVLALPAENSPSAYSGTGFFIAPGYLVTNYHVIEKGVKLMAARDRDSKPVSATLVASNPAIDMAILRVTDLSGTPVKIGTAAHLELGEVVYAIGNPQGTSKIITKGLVSARQKLETFNGAKAPMIVSDIAIDHGSSGGPLINGYGEVVGVNTQIDTQDVRIGFSVDIDAARDFLAPYLR
ncbi:MAG: serine protease [Verrucomicrobiae bacterium]|nr:serine protease [Verrucomicrobiae bacterium]